MRKIFTAVCITVFIAGVATYSASSLQRQAGEKAEPARSFRLIELESEVDAAGVETLLNVRTKDVDANGDWHSSVAPIGKTGGVEYSNASNGVVATKGKDQITLEEGKERPSAESLSAKRTVSFYKNHPNFAGTDVIAGLEVYKLRRPLDKGEGWLEMCHSPKTGASPLRVIVHSPDGSEHRIEAVKIEFR